MSDSALLKAAATLIRKNAECLRACHATPTGDWLDSDAEVKAYYEYEIGLAGQLEALAIKLRNSYETPLGALTGLFNEFGELSYSVEDLEKARTVIANAKEMSA